MTRWDTMANSSDNVEIAIVILSSLAAVSHCVSVALKLCQDYKIPKLWKYSFLFTNIAHGFLVTGILLVYVSVHVSSKALCDAAGFFLLFGVSECLLSLLTNGIILLAIQHPGKTTDLSTFHRNFLLFAIIPQVVIGAVLNFIPYTTDKLFDTSRASGASCILIRDLEKQGSLYGLGLVILWWIIVVTTSVLHVILVLKLWKFNNRINSAHYNVWQAQFVSQCKTHEKFLLAGVVIYLCVLVTLSVSVYSKSRLISVDQTWIFITSLAVAAILHGVIANVSDVMWTSCCCRGGNAVEEPHRKLKKLELLKIEVGILASTFQFCVVHGFSNVFHFFRLS